MGIKAIVESLDGIEEPLQALYVKDGEAYHLDVEGFDDHPKVRGVITANKENRAKRDEWKQKADDLAARYSWVPEDLDADGLEGLRAAADKGQDVEEIRERISASLEKKYRTEIEQRDERISTSDKRLRDMITRTEIDAAMTAATIDAPHRQAVAALIKASAKIDVDAENGTASVDTDLGPVPLAQYVREWSETEAGKIYRAKPGGPNPPGGRHAGRGKTISRSDFLNLSPAEQQKAIKDGIKPVDDR